MQLKDFMIKCLIVTFCIGILLNLFFPRYHFFDKNNRADKINGNVERFDYLGWQKR